MFIMLEIILILVIRIIIIRMLITIIKEKFKITHMISDFEKKQKKIQKMRNKTKKIKKT